MTEKTMDERVGDLENLAQTLRSLPGQVAQLDDRVADVDSRLGNVDSRLGNVELRLGNVELRLGNVELRLGDVELRLGDVESQIVQLRTEMGDEFSAVRKEMGEMDLGLQKDIASLGRETAAGFLRAGVEMRALFEAHLGRRAVIAGGNPTPDDPPSAP